MKSTLKVGERVFENMLFIGVFFNMKKKSFSNFSFWELIIYKLSQYYNDNLNRV